ncbi:Cyclic AMP receptor-like protein [Anaerolineales bacterium]|nr:Cyclic AMP receptor-like protein [Anaerolineales bacterium]
MKPLSQLLEQNPVFSSLTPNETAELVRMALKRTYQKDEKIILYGDVWPHIFLVGEGKVEALKESSDGRSLHVACFGKGELFWGLAFFHEDAPMPVTLQARENSVLYLWAKDSVLPIFLRNGQVSWEISRLMADRMQHASDLVEGLAFHPVAGRLARLLLDHFETAGDASISRYLTLDEMAARIGSTREMVCRALYSFSDKKLIEVTRTEFVLTDHEGLAQLSKGV